MKRILLAGTALLALTAAQPTLAADAPVYKGPAPYAAALFNWSGFYVGVDAGYHWSRVDEFIPAAAVFGTATASPNSFTFGGHIGYRYQFPNGLVAGIEGDLAWLNGNATGAFPGFPAAGFIVNTTWDASARGILGFAANRALFYVTGGASWFNSNGCGILFVAPTTCLAGTNLSDAISGWTIGAGLAFAFTDTLIGRVEYFHADYGTKTYALTGIVGGTLNDSVRTDKVRVGLSWKFGG